MNAVPSVAQWGYDDIQQIGSSSLGFCSPRYHPKHDKLFTRSRIAGEMGEDPFLTCSMLLRVSPSSGGSYGARCLPLRSLRSTASANEGLRTAVPTL